MGKLQGIYFPSGPTLIFCFKLLPGMVALKCSRDVTIAFVTWGLVVTRVTGDMTSDFLLAPPLGEFLKILYYIHTYLVPRRYK